MVIKQNPDSALYFFQGDKLVTVKQGSLHRTILRSPDLPLAEHQSDGTGSTSLLATDEKQSVLNVLDESDEQSHSFSAYGHDPTQPSNRAVLGFNGQPCQTTPRVYLLGNGYRAYSPVLMRSCSADSWSPFGVGGVNAYSYCTGDPVNHTDPTGHAPFPLRRWKSLEPVPKPLKSRIQSGLSTSLPDLSKLSAPQKPKWTSLVNHQPVMEGLIDRLPAKDLESLKSAVSQFSNTINQRSQVNAGRYFHGRTLNAGDRPYPNGVLPSNTRRYIGDLPESSGSSSASSRSSSPAPEDQQPYFVNANVRARESRYYSRQHDPR